MAGHDEPDWLRLQKTIFSRYVEQRLKDGGITKKITNLVEEMKSGELLLQLLEVMSGVSSGKKIKDTKLRIQQIQNVNDAIDFAKKVGVDFTKIRISAEDFVDGKEQSVLAAVFQIIIRFLKFDEEEDAKTGGGGIDVREALMLWLKNKTAGYNGVNIKDFTKSFHDGLPFLALIHKLRPRLVEYDTCVGRSAKVNVEEALSLGEKYLSIPQYISADDLPKLNEISMLVYLTDWYAGVVLLQKQDIAAARIGKLEDITELHDKLRANYLERAKALSSWVTSTIAAQADRTIDDTMAGAKARLEEFQTYKKVAKTEQIGLKLDALALYDNLAARLVNHKRPPFLPKGLIPSDLDHAFVELEKSEVARSQYLNAELNRQIQLAKLYRRFQGNASKLSAYASDKDAQIKALPSASSQDALDSLDSLDVIQIEVTQTVSGPLVELNKVGDNLVAERFEHKGDVTATQSSINANLKAVQDLIASLRHQLYEKLFHWYTSHAEGLVSWIQSTISTQADRTIDNSMAGVKARLEEFETYKKTAKAEHLQSYEDVKSLYENISSRLANHGKPAFTPAGLVPTDLAHHFQQLDQSESARSTYLHAELARQIQLAKLYRQFQGNTAKLGQWLKEKEGPLKTPLNINSVEDAESEIDAIDILSGELNNVTSGPLTDLQKLAHRLVSEHFEEHKSVSSIESDITHQFEQVQAEVKTKNAQANAQLQEQKAINERLYQAFASAVNALQSFVQTKRDALAAEEKHEPEQQLTVVEGLVADAQAATAGLVGAIESADRDLQSRELVNNPYTNVSTGDAISTLTSFTVLIQKKVALLKEQIDEKKRGGLSPEQIAEIHANFAYFDKDSNGFLNKKELRTCLQSLGEESTPQSINVILEKYDSGKKGTLTKAEFEIFIRESLGDTGTSEEIIKSFRLLTYDAPTFTEQNLVNVVNNRTFTDHHVAYLKQEVKQTEPGHYDYATWTAEAFAR